jgi:exosortase A-associated hydrolase 1
MSYQEKVVSFTCVGARLFGIISTPHKMGKRGVLFVVGGPQYRAGSHRQFTLLARQLASQGIPAMRFDYRGMGDSEGAPRDFTQVDDDIRAALDCFLQQSPEVEEVTLWGLCDGASAAMFYAHQDSRVTGLALINPWVRTEQGAAKAYLKHYYLQRLFDGDLWKKIFTGQFAFLPSFRSFFQKIMQLQSRKKVNPRSDTSIASTSNADSLPQKMAQCLRLFQGRTLFMLCSDDLTAQEFIDLKTASSEWQHLMARENVMSHDLIGANHTFSQRQWREQIGRWTIDWVKSPLPAE